jgi:hypothetical protein
LRIACAQDDVGIGSVLRIEEGVAADRDPRIGLGDLAELGSDVTFARARYDGGRRLALCGPATEAVRLRLLEIRVSCACHNNTYLLGACTRIW